MMIVWTQTEELILSPVNFDDENRYSNPMKKCDGLRKSRTRQIYILKRLTDWQETACRDHLTINETQRSRGGEEERYTRDESGWGIFRPTVNGFFPVATV